MTENKIISIVLCALVFFSIIHSFTIACSKNINNIDEDSIQNCIYESTKIEIYNPYEDVDFLTTNQYKANLHTHTTQSDGSSSPSEVIYHYHTFGDYDILALTDHNRKTWPWNSWIKEEPLVSSDSSEFYPDLNMLAVSGNELSVGHHRGSFLNGYSGFGIIMKWSFRWIQYQQGLSIFYHPGRYKYPVEWYQQYFDLFDDCVLGIEIYNQGDRYQNDRILWDQINKQRDPDDLIWGFSNDDMHDISDHAFRNYQHVFMNNLSENEFKDAMINGAFYCSYEPNGADSYDSLYGTAKTPKVIDINIYDTCIEINGSDVEEYQWFNDESIIVGTDKSLDVSMIDSNFVRLVLSNSYGLTYVQPFGIKHGSTI